MTKFQVPSKLPLLLLTTTMFAAAQQAPIQIHADLTDAPRKIFHADVDIPVHRGSLDLITPEWIPGAHGPDGPVVNIAGVRFEVDGKALPWQRDPVDTYEYHLDIPAGASMLHAHLDCICSRHPHNGHAGVGRPAALPGARSCSADRDPADRNCAAPVGASAPH